jgi:cold shock CspA family protein
VKQLDTIEAPDGHEVYFHPEQRAGHRCAAVKAGTEVVFGEEAGDKGPQASTVRVVSARARRS